MIAIMQLSMAYYRRTHRWAAPLIVYAGAILFIYGVVPNPVMESYAATSALLFAVSAWTGFGYIDAEHPTHQALVALHAGGIRRYYIGKLLAGITVVSILPSLFAVYYPLAGGKFERAATGLEIVAALLGHAVQAVLGLAVAAWFTSKLIAKHSHALLGLLLAVSASLASQSIEQELPGEAAGLTWLLPPIRQTMQFLTEWDRAQGAPGEWLLGIAWPALYGIAVLTAYVLVLERRRF
jgi:hypothetical protein